MDVSKYRASITPNELNWLLVTALQEFGDRKIKNILEIGVHKGYSLEVWRDVFDPDILVGIEPNVKELDTECIDKIGAEIIDQPTTRQIQNKYHLRSSTRYMAGIACGHEPVDFLFIDGDHLYDSVKADFNYATMVRDDGLVVFHDAVIRNHPLVEVYRFYEELENKYPERCQRYQEDGTGIAIYKKKGGVGEYF